MAPYSISINNKSGRKQSYAIFSGVPTIQHGGGSPLRITTRIISSVRAVASDEGQATFMLSKSWYATCGIYDIDYDLARMDGNRGKASSGTEVVDNREVKLSLRDELQGGRLVPGTFTEIDCADGTPSFTVPMIARNSEPNEGCFGVRTRSDFTVQLAEASKFVVGFTSSLRASVGPYATFVPEPNQVYHIAPSSKIYVCVGNFNSRDLIKPSIVDEPTTHCIDFKELATDQVTLTHNSRGMLTRVAVTETTANAVAERNAMMFSIPMAIDSSVTVTTESLQPSGVDATPHTSDAETEW